jgi:hypothetical protein
VFFLALRIVLAGRIYSHTLLDPNHWSESMEEATLMCLVQAHNTTIEQRDCLDSLRIGPICQAKPTALLQTRISVLMPYLCSWEVRRSLVDAYLDHFSRSGRVNVVMSHRNFFEFKLYERILTDRRGKRTIIMAYDSRLDRNFRRKSESAEFEGAELLLNMASCSCMPPEFMADYARFHLDFHPFNFGLEKIYRYDRMLTILVMEIKLLQLIIGKRDPDCNF